jgi:pyruvate,water dikinase
MIRQSDLLAWLKNVDRDDAHLVGEKAANLGELIQNNFPVPTGFVLTSYAYVQFLKENKLEKPIAHLLNSINYSDPNSIKQVSFHIRRHITSAPFSSETTKQIFSYYEKLDIKIDQPRVAVRTSPIGISHSMPSSVVPHDSLLNINGESVLIHAIREVWASLYDAHAIHYRHTHQIKSEIKTAIIIQKMIDADFSGVVFTSHPVNGDKNAMIIEAIYGLGEHLKNKTVKPDQYVLNKQENIILFKKVQTQDTMLVKAAHQNKEVSINKKLQSIQKISDSAVYTISEVAKKLEKHYFFPQDIEWSIQNNQLFITEIQPLREIYKSNSDEKLELKKPFAQSISSLLIGEPGSPGVGVGKVKILSKLSDTNSVTPEHIIVVTDTTKEYEQAVRRSSGVIVEKGGKSSHTARIARQYGIPAVIGVSNAKKLLRPDMVITVKGNTGEVLKGNIKLASPYNAAPISNKKLNTNVYVSLTKFNANDQINALPHSGIASISMDSLIVQYGTHPKKVLHDKKLADFTSFIGKELGRIAKNEYPKSVICTLSQQYSADFRSLSGGKDYEPQKEINPLLGYRGSYRHINDPRLLELELSVIKSVRAFGYNNLYIAIPYTRSLKEFELMKKYIHNAGFRRGVNFKVWLTCATPTNAIHISKYIDSGVDGIIIDANTLSQLMNGIDRSNENVHHSFNDLEESVLEIYKHVTTISKKSKIPVIFNAEHLSLSPDLVEKVIEWGISGISTDPDTVYQLIQYL